MDPGVQCVPYVADARSIKFHRLLDGEEVAEAEFVVTVTDGATVKATIAALRAVL